MITSSALLVVTQLDFHVEMHNVVFQSIAVVLATGWCGTSIILSLGVVVVVVVKRGNGCCRFATTMRPGSRGALLLAFHLLACRHRRLRVAEERSTLLRV